VPDELRELTRRFADLVARPPELLPLDEAMLLVAAHDHEVDLTAQLSRLDALAARCEPATVDGVIDVLFGGHGLDGDAFAGDADDYHHPDNSFLDRVLDRRRGLPILLSVLTAEVAARAGVCLAPVGMPGHFLLRDCAPPDDDNDDDDNDASNVFIDPFNSGRRLDRDGCIEIFTRLHPEQRFRDEFLDPVDNRAVLLRVLTNLVHTYTRRGPVSSLAWALHLRALLAGGEAWLHVARIRERTGDWLLAAEAWATVAAATTGDAATTAAGKAATARARAN
jgi:regulator of sirC expression with transglutaminase-like and TPR domain